MPCYRSGGCGPYENLPCNECPASRTEYLRMTTAGTDAAKAVPFKIMLDDTDAFAPHVLKPLAPGHLTMGHVRQWITEHPVHGYRFAVDLNVSAAPELPTNEVRRTLNALCDANNPARVRAEKAARDLIAENTHRLGLVTTPVMKFPEPDSMRFRLENIPEVDPVMSPNQKVLQRYDILRLFDVAALVAWHTALSVIQGPDGEDGRDAVERPTDMTPAEQQEKLAQRLMRGIANIVGTYDCENDDAGVILRCLLRANVPVTQAVLALYPLTRTEPSDVIRTPGET